MKDARYNFELLNGGEMLLVSPPPSLSVFPVPSIGRLASKIRGLGINLDLLDLGLDATKWFTDLTNLHRRLQVTNQKEVSIDARFVKGFATLPTREICDNICWALNVFRSEFSSRENHIRAGKFLFGAFHIFNGTCKISPFGYYSSPWQDMRLEEMFDNLLTEDDIFSDFFNRTTTEILKYDYKMIGISLTHGHQFVPAMSFAKALRLSGYDKTIVCGGAQISFDMEQMRQNPALYKYIDWYSPKRGELVFEDIKKYLQGEFNKSQIRNIIFLDKNHKPHFTGGYAEEPLRDIRYYDFDGLCLEDYLAPSVTLPINISSKCHWDNCNFCAMTNGRLVEKYSHYSADEVFNHMNQLFERFGCRSFVIADDSAPPRVLTELSRKIIDHQAPFKWVLLGIIPDENITEKEITLWAKAGCRCINTGFESASDRLLKIFGKKHRVADIERIAKSCYENEIILYCFGFYGHPLEQKEDIVATLEFRKKYKNIIPWITPGVWFLNPNSKDFNNAESLGITVDENNPPYFCSAGANSFKWDSPNKNEHFQLIKKLIRDYDELSISEERAYFADWIFAGQSLYIPYSWIISSGRSNDV